MTDMLTVLTALSVLLIVYHHAGYPLLLRLLGNRRRPLAVGDVAMEAAKEELPSVTIRSTFDRRSLTAPSSARSSAFS